MRIGQAGIAVLLILLAFALSSCGFLQGLFNKPPVAVIEAFPTMGEAPLRVEFDGSRSYDPDGNITGFEWDFTTDGLVDATGATTANVFNKPGGYITTLMVIDDLGAPATASVKIKAITFEPKRP